MVEPIPSGRLEGSEVLSDPLVSELLERRVICVLATFDEGAIHAVPMWFARDGERLVLATGSRSRKARNLERDTRATVVVHDSRPGFEVCGVSLTGTAQLVRGEEARRLIDRVHRRYVAVAGEEISAVREFLDSDDVALVFRPESALTWDERSSTASDALRAAGAALPLLTTEPRPPVDL